MLSVIIQSAIMQSVFMLNVVALLERLVMSKHSSILGPFVSYQKTKCCEYGPSCLVCLEGVRVFSQSIKINILWSSLLKRMKITKRQCFSAINSFSREY
jgi:hypothetical protein